VCSSDLDKEIASQDVQSAKAFTLNKKPNSDRTRA
jgi:hypothetical protein